VSWPAAAPGLVTMAESYQRTAVLAAAVGTGIADAIAAPGATAGRSRGSRSATRGASAH
jgi:hypothetical protein